MDIKEYVKNEFKTKNCAQIVLGYFYDSDELNALTAGFGGGFGTAKLCGSYAGGVAVLGLKFRDKATLDNKMKEFENEFLKVYNSLNCSEILGADYREKEGLKKIEDENLFGTVCVDLTANCIEILESLIARG
ncbi:MAG: C_GCAxxG_C_C family protein [Campylobacteraceae bacterium]|nr:C_GCAxxG_C_C family protein [Campylobacteraceae bacterium]